MENNKLLTLGYFNYNFSIAHNPGEAKLCDKLLAAFNQWQMHTFLFDHYQSVNGDWYVVFNKSSHKNYYKSLNHQHSNFTPGIFWSEKTFFQHINIPENDLGKFGDQDQDQNCLCGVRDLAGESVALPGNRDAEGVHLSRIYSRGG